MPVRKNMTNNLIRTLSPILTILIVCFSCNKNEIIEKDKIRRTRSYSPKLVDGHISLSVPEKILDSFESITIGSYSFGTVSQHDAKQVDFKLSQNGNLERSPNTPKHETKALSSKEILNIFEKNNHIFHSTTQVIDLKRELIYDENTYPGNPDSCILFIEIKFVEKYSVFNYSVIIDVDFMKKDLMSKVPISEVANLDKFIKHIEKLFTNKKQNNGLHNQ